MLSGLSPQTQNSYHAYTNYAQPPEARDHQGSLAASNSNRPSFEANNLQAGHKRKSSEIEVNNDSGDGGQVRRRISRACDQCNQLRTKCNGKHPCAHCTDNGLQCEYVRAHKKRGRAPKKDQDNTTQDTMTNGAAEPPISAPNGLDTKHSMISHASQNRIPNVEVNPSMSHSENQFDTSQQDAFYNPYSTTNNLNMNASAHLSESLVPNMSHESFNVPNIGQFSGNSMDGMQGATNVSHGFGFPLGDDYSVAFMGKAPMVESPDWMALTSPMFVTEPPLPMQPRPPDTLRFPVLRPLLPHIESIVPQNLACDFLEQYFASSTSAYLRPSNPYVLGYIFRKKSILHPTNPRPCTSALLASMLWIVAQTSDATFLTSQVDARAKICQKLLELTISMLKPLIHNASGMAAGSGGYTSVNQSDAGLSGLVVPVDHGGSSSVERVQIDNLATYIHLATVVSASERKAASLRWWNAAWSLARELRLGRELPPNEDSLEDASVHMSTDGYQNPHRNVRQSSSSEASQNIQKMLSEEDREERRRTWWLLYMQDRHLALCYNRPMFFLNKECEGLLQPLDDDVWQQGRFERAEPKYRKRGLDIVCTSHSVFGYFLPLMVILGEILDLNHARNRPRFGPKANQPRNWNETTEEITEQLQIFEQSLRNFEATMCHPVEQMNGEAVTPSVASGATAESHATSESALQTKTVVAYGTHIMHVLHILLTGKWDPIALLDDNDLWISSQSFVTATQHAVSAAEAVGDVIEYDPDLSFMPFFFGVYLLQGSFLLLLFADKLKSDVSPDVVKACETIVRAHEACVATLDTQYQRNFRKVMRSALQQVRGRMQEDPTEQRNWRREVLKLYRWTGDGTGLAL